MLRIALIGHDTGNPNLGVGALTVSDIEIVRGVAQQCGVPVEFVVLVGKRGRQGYVHADDVTERFVRPLRKPWDFYSAVRSSDIVIDISGGDSFTDLYGGKRIFQDLLQKSLAHLAGRPLVLAPQTIGPFGRAIWKKLAARALGRARFIATRDSRSTAFLREMGVHTDIVEASDVALRLPYETPGPRPEGPPRIGINISGLLMSGGYSRNNMFGLKADYPELISRAITRFREHDEGCEIHLVGHVIPDERGGVEDDYQACLDVAEKFPDVIVAPAFATPSEAKSYIAGLDFFIGARMHACIAAFSSGVPVVPMAYSRKFAGLFGSLGYDKTVDCRTETTETCLERIFAAYEQRASIAEEMGEARARGFEKLAAYEGAMGALLLSLAR